PTDTARPRQTAESPNARPFPYRQLPRVILPLRRFQNRDHTRGPGAAKILRQSDAVPCRLPLAGVTAELRHHVANLSDTCGAHWMALRFQSATCINWKPPG